MSKKTAVTIAGVEFKNPVMTASGTFGHGEEYDGFVDINRLGGVVVKGVSAEPWPGNPPPRVAETYGGMLNAVGLQNPGVKVFIDEYLPYLRRFDTNIIVNVCGHSAEEYAEVAEALAGTEVDMLELNISCPNVSEGCIAFGTDPAAAAGVVGAVKKHARQPLIVKLSPNVTDIATIARAAESAGADAVSLINTLLGMRIDIKKRRPVLGNTVGGLSGQAVKPVALRMVWEVYKAVSVPIIGMGGISNGEDAIEFIMAGATGVAVGTANFANPSATTDIIEGIGQYLEEQGINDINGLIGAAHRGQ